MLDRPGRSLIVDAERTGVTPSFRPRVLSNPPPDLVHPLLPPRLVDLSVRSRSGTYWRPAVDDFGKPAENALFVELAQTAGLRVYRNPDGSPSITVEEGRTTQRIPVPSEELEAFLDRWRISRRRNLLDETTVAKLVRLLKARVGSPEFEEPGLVEPEAVLADWDESLEAMRARVAVDDFGPLRQAILRLAGPNRLFAFRPTDLAYVLSTTTAEAISRIVGYHHRLADSGVGVRTIPSTGGPLFLAILPRGRS